MAIRPFRFDLLPRLRRDHLATLRVLRGHLGPSPGRALESWGKRHGIMPRVHVGAFWTPRSDQIGHLLASGATVLSFSGSSCTRICLVLDGRVAASLLGLVLRTPGAPRAGALTPAERGLIHYELTGLLHELGPDCPWSLDTADQVQLEGDDWVVVEASVILGDVRGQVWLLLDPSLPQRAACRVNIRADASLQRLAGLRLSLPIEGGRIALPVDELELLGEGDVILSVGCSGKGESREALLRIGHGGFPVTIDNNGRVTLVAPFRTGGMGMGTSESERTALAEELAVEIVVELGRIQVTAARVVDLQQGDVLTLDRPLATAVDLRVGDRLIARGELVDVDGDWGVRLTEAYE